MRPTAQVFRRLLPLGWSLGMLVCLAAAASEPANLFFNPSFENGRDGWLLGVAHGTSARFTVDDKEAAAGRRSALVHIDAVAEWGVQFGQTMDAPAPGQTWTFAAVAKATKSPVTVRLEIERRGGAYDRAAACPPVSVAKDAWTEMHVTFKVEKRFSEGWFAYVSCKQPGAEFRVDMFRLYQGPYVPYEKAAREEAAAAAVCLFDTAAPSSAPLPGALLAARAGWTKLPEDQSDHKFRGDAVLVNDRLALVLRRGAPGAELYCQGPKGFALRAVLSPAGGPPDLKLGSPAIAENTASQAALDVSFESPGGKTLGLRCGLAMGESFVKTEPRDGATGLFVEAPCRFAVLPDFFADDIVVDAAEIPVPTAELPSENFLLHLSPDHEAIVMTVAGNRGRDAQIDLAGEGTERLIRRSRMDYGPKGKIWVAVIAGSGVWHARDVSPREAGKVLPLDWTAPFPAQWRVDWRLANRLTGSWEMAAQRAGGGFTKFSWFGSPGMLPADRKHWTTVYGSFQYPCWLDLAGRGYFQPLARPDRIQGPAVIYPINRSPQTPLTEFTVVDLVRATLGVGPCEYILDVEGQGTTTKGRATCWTRDFLKGIYAAHEQKKRKAEVEKALVDVVTFVKHIRGRIEQYVDFGHETLAYLQQQEKAHPALAGFLADMEDSTRAIDAAVAKRKANIKTPQYVVDLTDRFRATVMDYEGDDALVKCRAITEAIVQVGGNQDELVGECRGAVKVLRQRAGLAMATDPQAAEIAREIRDRTQKVLRNATGYESPRH
ncbi:MAG: carbohydrate binding domain-containing protein [Thermoguttaceae bacterium]